MKKAILLVIVFIFMFAFLSPAMAEPPKSVDKAYHGLEKMIKAPMHLVNDPAEEYKAADFKPFGLFGGLLKGISYTAIDLVHGAYEVVVSPFAMME